VSINAGHQMTWPVRIGVVPRLADGFQTRAAVDELTVATSGGGTAVVADPARVVSGLGGVGKSQLAIQHAEHLWHAKQIDMLVWITATTRDAILAEYAEAASALSLPGADGGDTARDAARFLAWLAGTERRWLVVLDDLAAVGDLQNLWPPTMPYGQTVVTTRLRDPALTGGSRHLIDLDVFTPIEAAAYLSTRLANSPHLANDIDGLAHDLGYLPLALSQAAAFILGQGIPCSGYRQRFADRDQCLDDLVPLPDQLPDDYTRTIAATLSLSIEAADGHRPAGMAAPLLRLTSVLDPATIPTAVLTSKAARTWLAAHTPPHAVAPQQVDHFPRAHVAGKQTETQPVTIDMLRAGLRVLHRFNLVTDRPDRISVHAIVQRTVRDQLTDQQLADTVNAGADAVIEVWPDIDRNGALAQALRANTTVLYQRHPTALLAPGCHSMLRRAHRSLADSGNPTAAALGLTQMLSDQTEVLGPNHPDTLATRHHLASRRGDAGDALGAVTAFEQLLADRIRVLGPDHPDTLTTRYRLARWRGEAGDAAGAAVAAEQLLADQLKVQGPDHPDTLETGMQLAHWRGETGDAAAAIIAFEQLLADQLRVQGPDHPDTLITRGFLARWRRVAGEIGRATTELEQLGADLARVLGPNHPFTLANRHNLASWREASSDAWNQLLDDMQQVL
jgi:hypothetical protein